MNNYKGYLIKAADGTVLDKYIEAGTYSATPDQRQDKDSYRDGLGELHRKVLPCVCTTLAFSTAIMSLDDKIAFQSAILSGLEDGAERRVSLTYWNDEINGYCTDIFYMPDIKYPIKHITEADIVYGSIEIKLIGYGQSRSGD